MCTHILIHLARQCFLFFLTAPFATTTTFDLLRFWLAAASKAALVRCNGFMICPVCLMTLGRVKSRKDASVLVSRPSGTRIRFSYTCMARANHIVQLLLVSGEGTQLTDAHLAAYTGRAAPGP